LRNEEAGINNERIAPVTQLIEARDCGIEVSASAQRAKAWDILKQNDVGATVLHLLQHSRKLPEHARLIAGQAGLITRQRQISTWKGCGRELDIRYIGTADSAYVAKMKVAPRKICFIHSQLDWLKVICPNNLKTTSLKRSPHKANSGKKLSHPRRWISCVLSHEQRHFRDGGRRSNPSAVRPFKSRLSLTSHRSSSLVCGFKTQSDCVTELAPHRTAKFRNLQSTTVKDRVGWHD
jgi:hypothetical protein